MTCQRCGLPDLYRGQGDGIGSCDCPRCQCCGGGPDDCDCGRDWDPYVYEDDDPADDNWCNDPACPTRQARITAAESGRRVLTDDDRNACADEAEAKRRADVCDG